MQQMWNVGERSMWEVQRTTRKRPPRSWWWPSSSNL